MLLPGRLRSRLIVCVMAVMVQGAHRGRPVAAAPCTPRAPASNIAAARGTFDLSLQASGRAEAASVQNTALSPHPCGLPRPSGNVSAMLRAATAAVSARMVNKLTAGRTDRRPGKAPAATRHKSGSVPDGIARWRSVYRAYGVRACEGPGNKAALCLMASPGGAALTGPTRCDPVRGSCRPGKAPAATRQ